MTNLYLSLGSNVGDRKKFLDSAVEKLHGKISDIIASSMYETEPWGNLNQPQFLNMCLGGQTDLKPGELLEFIKSIESSLGRKHTEKWGPREIDIDILFYGDGVIDTSGIEIPHPFVAERAFVLIPLAEIAPDFKHPVLKKTVKELAESIDGSGVRKAGIDA